MPAQTACVQRKTDFRLAAIVASKSLYALRPPLHLISDPKAIEHFGEMLAGAPSWITIFWPTAGRARRVSEVTRSGWPDAKSLMFCGTSATLMRQC
jgi:hypothetical protein